MAVSCLTLLFAFLLPQALGDCAEGSSCPAAAGQSMLQRVQHSADQEELEDEAALEDLDKANDSALVHNEATPSGNNRRRRREPELHFCMGWGTESVERQEKCVRTTSEIDYDYLAVGADPKPLIRDVSQYQQTHGGQVYGLSAVGDATGKMGGGTGYTRSVQIFDALIAVSTAEQLAKAVKDARDGDTIFVVGHRKIDMSKLPTTAIGKRWKAYLVIDKKITLASDRGTEGGAGALLDFSKVPVGDSDYIYGIYASKPVRIAGLRIRGNLAWNVEREKDDGRKARSVGVLLRAPSEVDNCELFSWIHACIRLDYESKHLSSPIPLSHVHHSHIHSTHFFGLGYGIGVTKGNVRVEWTQFQRNRHAIASNGGDYDAWEMGNCAIFKPNIHSMVDMHETKGQYFQLWNSFLESYFYFKDRGEAGGVLYPAKAWAAFNYVPEAKDGSDWGAYRGLDCNYYSQGVWKDCDASKAAKLLPSAKP